MYLLERLIIYGKNLGLGDWWPSFIDGKRQEFYYKTGEVIGEYIIKMTLGDGSCIVIGEEGPSIWISNENGNGGILVVSIYEEEFNEKEFIEKIRKIPNNEYRDWDRI